MSVIQSLGERRRAALGSLLWATLAAGAVVSTANSQQRDGTTRTPRTAQERPALTVTRAPGAIVIDGTIDDVGWDGAARAVTFTEFFPKEGETPTVESEVWVTYDDQNLYLAFLAFDDPSTVRASRSNRDEIWSDDYFGIVLDTFGDGAWAYYLFANPLGVQGDSRFTATGDEDLAFDVVYHTEGRVTQHGYHIEMAVPFASLRFPGRTLHEWRATFWRVRPRSSYEEYSWAAIDRDEPCFLCQLGTLAGIHGVRPGGVLELLPTAMASQSGVLEDDDDPASRFHNAGIRGDVSLGVRYALPTGLTLEGTFNPDFSQVESDIAQIDVNTTFALFFPERRPFFQEGSDLFVMPFDVLYTRRINNPQFATKVVGRWGRSSVMYLAARDEDTPLLLPFEESSFVGTAGGSVSNIARFRQTFLQDSYLGLVLSDRRLVSGGSGSVGGVDGQIRLLKNYSLAFQFLFSHTREPSDSALTAGISDLTFADGRHTGMFDGESYAGLGQYVSVERSARLWSFQFDYRSSSPTFRTDNGFEFRNDFRQVSMWQGLTFYPKTTAVTRVAPSVYVESSWNHEGVRKVRLIQPGITFELAGQTIVEFWYSAGAERFGAIEFDGVQRWNVSAHTNVIEEFGVEVVLSRGETVFRDPTAPLLGVGTELEASATIKPAEWLVFEPHLEFAQLRVANDGPLLFRGYIARARTSVQFTRGLFLRIVLQYDDFSQTIDVEPLLTYRVSPFTHVFVGSTHSYRQFEQLTPFTQTSRQVFGKLQYLFRR